MILKLFAGADGAGIGIARALPDVPSVGLEMDRDCCVTLAAAGVPAIRCDITRYPPHAFAGHVTGAWASPPCTDFSQAGKRRGLDGETGYLIYEAHLWVSKLEPEWFVFENTPTVLPWWKRFARDFAERDYSTWAGVLDPANYGTPQNRPRAILLASRRHHVRPPEPTHFEHPHPRFDGVEELPWVSMGAALGWEDAPTWLHGRGETFDSGGPAKTVCGHRMPAWLYTGSNSAVHGHEAEDYEPYCRETTRPAPVVDTKAHKWRLDPHRDQRPDGSTQTRDLDRPAPAVTGKAGGQWVFDRPSTTVQATDRIAKPGHHERQWSGAIKVTLEELAVLQDFPPDWPFVGNKTSVSRQIGNAVPAKLAEACVRAVA